MENKKQTGVLAVVTALLTGITIGVLFAPKKGEETRKDIKKTAEKIGKEVAEKAEETEKLTRQKYDEIVEAVADSYKKLKKLKKVEIDKITASLKEQGSEVVKRLKPKK